MLPRKSGISAATLVLSGDEFGHMIDMPILTIHFRSRQGLFSVSASDACAPSAFACGTAVMLASPYMAKEYHAASLWQSAGCHHHPAGALGGLGSPSQLAWLAGDDAGGQIPRVISRPGRSTRPRRQRERASVEPGRRTPPVRWKLDTTARDRSQQE